ncbi:protein DETOXIFICATION 45, chloroplastic isoform X2 [Selaginella moellendorffii]|uniref:protein DETOXIFICATION 45, chloroplastic isoform X2 n=1 Tax=Selaginella moellendorffii TaxID=88036 RepID=UPI000D1C83A8|nr:protein DETOXIFICATION 45, chloroplastic isoform X2 [Selaginella moellendorffii]|eukprot:XP_024532908.1 protein DETOXIFICATION 45, chloroplastic isoform X2 [Selaginella moellendorffii]
MGALAPPPVPAALSFRAVDRDPPSQTRLNAAGRSRIPSNTVSFRHWNLKSGIAFARCGGGCLFLARGRRSRSIFCSLSADEVLFADKADGNPPADRSLLEDIVAKDGLAKEVAVLAFPALLGQAIEPLALLTETAFVGRLGAVELAAVGVSISAFNYVSKCFNIPLLSVTTSFVAEDDAAVLTDDQQSDAKKYGKQVLPAVSSALVLGCAIGLIEALLLGCQGGRLLKLMGVAKDSVMAPPARQYLVFRALAAPAAVLSLTLQGIFRGLKDTKTPLYATAIASLSNIVLGATLIFGLKFGVVGAAFAYGASQYAMMFYLLWCLNKRAILLPPKLKDLKFERFLKNGGLLLGRTLSILSIMTLSTSMATRQGTIPMAAHQVCMQLWLAASLLSDSLAIAVQALLAGAFAKRDYRRAKLVSYRVLQMGFSLGILMTTILGTSSSILSKLFTSDIGVLKVMSTIMPFVALTQPINSLAFVFDGIHYGASDFRYSTYAMMSNALVSSAVLLLAPRRFGLPGVWMGLTLVMALRAAAGFLRLTFATGPWSFLRDKWEERA